MLGQVQNAASNAVDHTIHSSAVGNHIMNPTNGFDQHSRRSPLFAESQESRMRQSVFSAEGENLPSMPPPVARTGVHEGWNGPSSKDNNQR
jgi:hypothetical protein